MERRVGSEESAPPTASRRFGPIGLGAAVAGLGIVLLVVFTHPGVRAWLRGNLFLPMVARVLGRDEVVSDGVAVAAGPGPYVTLAIAFAYVLTLLLIRLLLLNHAGAGARRVAQGVRIDSSMALAVLPFVALAAVIEALAMTRLFEVPWAFFAVPLLLVHLVVGILLLSLVLAVWTEHGGARHHRLRFFAVLLLFLVIGLSWTAVLQGTTRPLPWWIPLVALLLTFAVYHGVTLGGRLVSHRRALFSFGAFHLFFFAGFLAVWFIEGPWLALAWRFEDQGALRPLYTGDARLLVLTLGPPMLVAVGLYTIGSFLHRYSLWARVWVDGLHVVAAFAQVLEGWIVTLAVSDPYGAFDRTEAAHGPFAAWAVTTLGGWGYFWFKLVFAVVVITALHRFLPQTEGRRAELRTLLLAGLAALALAPGLRLAITLAAGV